MLGFGGEGVALVLMFYQIWRYIISKTDHIVKFFLKFFHSLPKRVSYNPKMNPMTAASTNTFPPITPIKIK